MATHSTGLIASTVKTEEIVDAGVANHRTQLQLVFRTTSNVDRERWGLLPMIAVRVTDERECPMLIKQLLADKDICFTGRVAGLSSQIIEEMNVVQAGVLVSFTDLPVALDSLAVNAFTQPAAKKALAAAIAARGGPRLPIASAYRTIAQQLLLFRWAQARRCGISIAAAPGKSNHENGLALDTHSQAHDFSLWKKTLENNGWKGLGSVDPPHFAYQGAGVRRDIAKIGIQAFQLLWNRHNPSSTIAADGIYGPKTEQALLNSPVEGFNHYPDDSLSANAGSFLRLTVPFTQGPRVLAVQKALNVVRAPLGLPILPTDGVFGLSTQGAVMEFQTANGLNPDGVVGPITLMELGLPVP